MKQKVLYLWLFLGCIDNLFGQNSPEFTAWSRMVMNGLKNYVNQPENDRKIPPAIKDKYGLLSDGQGSFFLRAIVKSDHPDTTELNVRQIVLFPVKDNLYTAIIPLTSLPHLSHLKSINTIDFGKKVHKRLDKALKASKADLVHTGASPLSKAYLGKDVYVGIIDYGFDFTHPMFSDAAGNTRIQSCWNQNGFGKTPKGYNYGEEISGNTDLLNAISSTSDESHGTHVLGIAAGNGNGSNGQFVGFAPEATPVLVDLRYTDADLLDGIKYIFSTADKSSKPAVVNLSLGSHIGPHDGTSLTDLGIDKLSGKGHIICGASGNEADIMLHASHNFQNDSFKTLLHFEDNFDQTGSGTIDVWGDQGSPFGVSVSWFDEINRYEILRTPFYVSDRDAAGDTLIIFRGDSLIISWASTKNYSGNGKSNIIFDIENLSTHYTGLNIYKASGTVHLWNDGLGMGADFTNVVGLSKVSGYSTGDNITTCGEIGGTAHQIITVGSYTTKTSYINLKKNTIDLSSYATLNDLAIYSSRGPTVDGRTKPDISAPGVVVASAVSSDDINYDATSDEVVYKSNFGGVDYFYAAFEGTSMSTPCVTGAVALLLEARKDLNPDQVKNILAMTALTDSYTGTIGPSGSNSWGYGKLNLFDAIQKATSFNGITQNLETLPHISIFPNPTQHDIYIQNNSGTPKSLKVSIFNASGALIWQEDNYLCLENSKIVVDHITAGMYIISLADAAGNTARQKILIQP